MIVCLPKELGEVEARLGHTPQKSLRCLLQETGISTSSAVIAIDLCQHVSVVKDKAYRTNPKAKQALEENKRREILEVILEKIFG